jgi:hypothetical protein
MPAMIRVRPTLIALALAFSAGAAQSQPPVPEVGATVRDAAGQVLGRIEAVTLDNTGRPVQVVVRARTVTRMGGDARSIPIASLRPDREGWSTPLRRAEFDLLPKLAK